MDTELAIQPKPASLTKEGLDHTRDQLALLEQFVKDVLREDQDYGIIPGTDKPTLLKPGAANIIAAFACHSEPTPITTLLDVSGNFVAYEHRVDIINNESGRIVASGMGGCNSHETKYRYRTLLPTCPQCGKDNIRPSKQGGGYFCWQKTEGCGTNLQGDDSRITSQPAGKIENPDQLDLSNTIMKMSIKRAEVDAAMKLPGVARFFTQDLEDMAPLEPSHPQQESSGPVTRRSGIQRKSKAAPADPSKVTITSAEANGLMTYADEIGVPRPGVMAELQSRHDLDSPLKLDSTQLEEMRHFIETSAPDPKEEAQDGGIAKT